ncbi:hypothetical protein [Parasitella parasitica]|uniref:PiggyBac transposable element-derived protein domain-containing protein n=1 Tax=Parasitella parasitica TaxID=35722 RepID=A0A0B7NJ05_9FUNG|nr:hypothetical protein [Parasitella parasitica]
MPPSNSNLNENSIITISKRFIKDKRAKELLLTKFDWNTPESLKIRSTIQAFNTHMSSCITPGKCFVIDESMNQWLGIGQEFKTLADHHTYCILQIDTVSDPKPKEYDSDEGMRKLTATVKRLVKPWFGTGRTVIADSWFGAPDITTMLTELGLYYIMQVAKRRYWPRGMPTTDVVEHTDNEPGSIFTMKNQQRGLLVTTFRHLKVKAFISSCGTTRLSGSCAVEHKGQIKQFARPAVVDEYEKHKVRLMLLTTLDII